MKICCFTYTFLPTVGGAEFLLHRLAESLTGRGHHVTVIAPLVRGKNNRIKTGYRLMRYVRPISKRFGVRQTLVYLSWEYARRRFDVLHCHGAYPAAFVGAAFKKYFKPPVVVRPHGADILPGEWIRQDARLERRMKDGLAVADAVISQGRSIQEELIKLGVDAQKIVTIHNGVVRAPARPIHQPASPPYLFSMGSLSLKKGYDVLLHAFAILATQFPNLRLIVAGDGARRFELLAMASNLGLTDRVRWIGEISGDGKSQWLSGAAVYVSSSRREPFSNALLESMAEGLPIVATNVGGNAEMIEDGRSGLLTPPEDPSALAAAIRQVLADDRLRQKLSEGAWIRSEAYDWERMVDQYEQLYQWVLPA